MGARIVATATAWVYRGSVQLANTTIALLVSVAGAARRALRIILREGKVPFFVLNVLRKTRKNVVTTVISNSGNGNILQLEIYQYIRQYTYNLYIIHYVCQA